MCGPSPGQKVPKLVHPLATQKPLPASHRRLSVSLQVSCVGAATPLAVVLSSPHHTCSQACCPRREPPSYHSVVTSTHPVALQGAVNCILLIHTAVTLDCARSQHPRSVKLETPIRTARSIPHAVQSRHTRLCSKSAPRSVVLPSNPRSAPAPSNRQETAGKPCSTATSDLKAGIQDSKLPQI
eukprot:2928284-Rhodomonas_salina.1